MRIAGRHIAFGLSATMSLWLAACGGGFVQNPPPANTTPAVTVTPSAPSITTAQALTVTIALSGTPAPTGSVILSSGSYASAATTLSGGSASILIPASSLPAGNDTLTASYTPDAASSSAYNSASGFASVAVTAPAKTTPVVTVTPSAPSITTAQALTVTIALSGSPAPTGSVILSGGSYASTATALSGGSTSILIPAGSLPVGNDTLTASYSPDAASSSSYNSASGTAPVTVTIPVTYTLTVDSASPSSGIAIVVTPADVNGYSNGATRFTRTYSAGTAVMLTAPVTSGSYTLINWTGCASYPSASLCDVTMNANITVTATFNEPEITSITVSPTTATIGSQVQFQATVNGTGSFSHGVTWAMTCPACVSLSAGTFSSTGFYTTPYPAPATVTVTATSTMAGFTNISGSAIVTLSPPAATTGPALSVNVGSPGASINPEIYGMNAYLLRATAADSAAVDNANIPIDRWGGDSTERYNYRLDVTSSIADWYFINSTGNGGDGWPAVSGVKAFDNLVESNNANGIKTLGTVPVLGWVAKDSTSCSFPQASNPGEVSYSNGCGDGELPNASNPSSPTDVYGNNTVAALTSIPEPPPAPPATVTAAWANATWTGSWVDYLVNKFGAGNSGAGVSVYDLDNEPSWWDAEDRDVHPLPFTYDEVTQGGIGTALAIKTADPAAQVSGPVMDWWWDYFYSKKDVESGWDTGGPCYQPWSHPVDRTAHGGIPFIEYYLQQMAAAQTTYGKRLLDYVDLHTYFAAQYPAGSGNGVAFATAGDTGAQQARLNSTRVFWDPNYTDASGQFPQPNYITDANYTTSCSPPQQAPQLIPMMKKWVTTDYPGTKLAIDEYNWGGLEAINGALAQADILGIFGREGLDLGAFWPADNPSKQIPGTMAFAIYRNYDGNKSTFGDTVLPSTSTNASNADGEGQLAVYGARRNSDSAVTVVVINKTYSDLTSTLSLNGLSASTTSAQAYLYSNANLNAIVAQPAVTVKPPAAGGAASTITATFPAQSITLLVAPN